MTKERASNIIHRTHTGKKKAKEERIEGDDCSDKIKSERALINEKILYFDERFVVL